MGYDQITIVSGASVYGLLQWRATRLPARAPETPGRGSQLPLGWGTWQSTLGFTPT